MPLIFTTLASLLYLYGFGRLWRTITHPEKPLSSQVLTWIITFAVLAHGMALSQQIIIGDQLNLHLGAILSLIGWLAVAVMLLINLKQPIMILGLFVFPLSAIFALSSLLINYEHLIPVRLGSHVLLSIAAYSLLTLATAQAILYSIQEKRFKQKKVGAILNILPPLQVMEKVLIKLVIAGYALLTLALLSGALFVNNLFAQHLVHKTFFAIIAWLIYTLFLWGHFQRGWRGQKAAKYIIWAYVLLSLSYIGTNFILMFIYG